jgi:ABC-type multidrug transport system fused ATPase/permease subunit
LKIWQNNKTNCDNVALFEDGQIIEYGTHDELLSMNGKYASMFNIQAHYYADV